MTNSLILHMIQLMLVSLIVWVIFLIVRNARRRQIDLRDRFFTGFGIGLVTDLLDTLGIGTFATTTTLFKATQLVKDDRQIPATMTTAHVIPVLVEALCFITIVEVDLTTLVCMAAAAFSGAFLGARLTKNWNTQKVQMVLGVLLIIAAFFMVYRMLTNPGADIANDIRGLSGIRLLIGIVFDFIIGMLMTMGLGNYAPELIFFSLMGISPAIALPVMMLNAAMIMVAGSKQFIESDRVHWPGVLGIIIGGVFGVLIAAFFLTSLDIDKLKILVVFIALYTGLMLLRSALIRSK
ncbi:sulfite exporter TauE/SafE family protein [Streptococcus pantholopis]|uniref:Probable membrane transporter protein n=1 Tax=Streptococcus pantholopis TaxID=1811193 RepID=A0A172QAL3_9STRE|nr:sulfite exporter TauE/SafE family protein [Streptococcus pantholopis]AND80462.1 sodium:solute symporter [Streptococcus pantholopis]